MVREEEYAMAIYHLSIQNIGRSAGRSAVAAAAYRSATKLIDSERGLTCDYSRKSGVVYTEVMLCQIAPQEYADREKLWNAVEKIEKQKDARLAREINVALPHELDRETQIKIVRDYVQENFVKAGMCADIALHDKGDGNPHAHIMLTTRPIDENGKWGAKEKKVYALDSNGEKIPVIDENTGKQKLGARNRKLWQRVVADTTGWNAKENVEKWRAAWAKECNRYLSQEQAIDHRSFQRQGIERVPTIHEGTAAREIEKRTGESHKVKKNREIKEINIELSRIEKLVKVLHRQIDDLKRTIQKGRDRINERIQRLLDRRAADDARRIAEPERGAADAAKELRDAIEQGQGRTLGGEIGTGESASKADRHYANTGTDADRAERVKQLVAEREREAAEAEREREAALEREREVENGIDELQKTLGQSIGSPGQSEGIDPASGR